LNVSFACTLHIPYKRPGAVSVPVGCYSP